MGVWVFGSIVEIVFKFIFRFGVIFFIFFGTSYFFYMLQLGCRDIDFGLRFERGVLGIFIMYLLLFSCLGYSSCQINIE